MSFFIISSYYLVGTIGVRISKNYLSFSSFSFCLYLARKSALRKGTLLFLSECLPHFYCTLQFSRHYL